MVHENNGKTEVKKLTPDQALNAYLRAQQDLKALKEPVREHLAKISKQERAIKDLRTHILTIRAQVDKEKWDLVIDHVDVPAYSYDKITILKKK